MASPYRQPSGTWAFVVEGPRVDGRRRQIRRKGFRTKREAQAAMDRLRADVAGSYYTGETVKVAELADEWVAAMRVRGEPRPDTIAEYESKLRRHVLPAIGRMKVRDVTPRDLTNLYAKVGETLSPRTVNYVHVTCSAMFKYAVNVGGYITKSPTDKVDTPKVPRKPGDRIKAWTEDELAEFLETIAGDPQFALWHTFVHTGLRRSELVQLNWGDLRDGRLHVTKSQQRTGTVGATKRDRSYRTVTLTEQSKHVLAAHWEETKREAGEWGWEPSPETPMFCWADGTRFKRDWVTRRWEVIRPDWLPPINLHGLRHSHGTVLLRTGVPVHVIAARMGHDPSELLRTYGQIIGTMDEDAADAFAGRLEVRAIEG